MEKLYAVTLLLVLTTSSGVQLQSDVERPCPGDRVEFTCTISSDGHLWEVPNLNITQGLLRNSTSISDPPFEFAVSGMMPDSITSIAVVIVTTPLTEVLNGTLILCQDDIGTEPEQNTTINLRAPPSAAPGTPSVSFSIPGQQFTITWNEPTLNMGELVDAYFVNISGPNDLCGNGNTLQRVTERSYMCSMQTTPQVGDTYTIRVAAASCGGDLTGPESEPLHLQVPDAPTFTFQPDCPGLTFVDIVWQNTGMIRPAITEVCVNCTGVNCMSECRPVSGNNRFRINNIVNGTNYTVSLSLRNDFGQSEESAPELYVNNDEQCPPTTSTTSSTPQTQPSASPPQPPPNASSTAGAIIAGGVIGGLIGVIIIVLIIVVAAYLIWRKNNSPKPKRSEDIKQNKHNADRNGDSPENMYQDPNTIVHETVPSGEVYAVVDKSQELRYTEIGFTTSGEAPEQEPGVVYSDVQNV